jgi:hypothetical protein
VIRCGGFGLWRARPWQDQAVLDPLVAGMLLQFLASFALVGGSGGGSGGGQSRRYAYPGLTPWAVNR